MPTSEFGRSNVIDISQKPYAINVELLFAFDSITSIHEHTLSMQLIYGWGNWY